MQYIHKVFLGFVMENLAVKVKAHHFAFDIQ